MSTKPWYRIRAKADDEAEVLIYDEIGQNWFGEGVTAERFIEDIQAIEAETLNVRINSVGGQVFEGLAIFNALKRHPSRVVTHVDGLAASIASVVALAGEEVRIAANAFLMVHNPHGIVIGNAGDMREMAATLDKIAGSLAETYVRRTGKSEDEVRAWMDGETWFTAEEAEEAGFVDVVTEEREIKAAGDLSRFRHVPEALRSRAEKRGQPEPEPEPEEDELDLALVALAAETERTLSRTLL